MNKGYLSQNEFETDLPVLDWECLRLEIESFYHTNKPLFDQITHGKDISIKEAAQEVFYRLISDYAQYKNKPEGTMLNYTIAEAWWKLASHIAHPEDT